MILPTHINFGLICTLLTSCISSRIHHLVSHDKDDEGPFQLVCKSKRCRSWLHSFRHWIELLFDSLLIHLKWKIRAHMNDYVRIMKFFALELALQKDDLSFKLNYGYWSCLSCFINIIWTSSILETLNDWIFGQFRINYAEKWNYCMDGLWDGIICCLGMFTFFSSIIQLSRLLWWYFIKFKPCFSPIFLF